MTNFKYRAFISYSHRDNDWATWLHRSLESYKPPRKLIGQPARDGAVPQRIGPVFRDRDELPTATELSVVINYALKGSACQIVVCSPDAARSRWVNEEILAYKRLGREDRILCLIVGGEPNASDNPDTADQECFPEALRYKIGPDGELSDERTEPIAADARPGKDGRNNAKLKLIAGMLGVGFDALRQRELHRRQRRMIAITSAATAGMIFTTSLATVAMFARADAERQAETANRTREFMVELFRVSDPSEARGNEITARDMLDRGARRIATELADEPEIQATLMNTIGSAYSSLGLLDEALPMLESALAKRQERLGSRHPESAATQADLANLLRLRSDYMESERLYREALAIQRQSLGSDDPAVATSLTGLAALLSEVGRFSEAESALREALSIREAAFGARHPDVAVTLDGLAMTVGRQGDLETAIALAEEAVGIQRQWWGEGPQTYVAEALNNLGYLTYAQGDYERTESLFAEALAMSRAILPERHYDLATGINNLAFLLHDQDKYEQAEEMYREVLLIEAESSGDNTAKYANALNNLAYVLYDQGDMAGALEKSRQSLAIYAELFPDGYPGYADTLAGIGAWLFDRGDLDEAETMFSAGLAMRESLFGPDHPDYANSLAQMAMLALARQSYEEALSLSREAQGILAGNLPPGHWRSAFAATTEGASLAGLGAYADAEELLLDGYAILAGDPGALPVYVNQAKSYLYALYTAWGQSEKAALYRSDSEVSAPN